MHLDGVSNLQGLLVPLHVVEVHSKVEAPLRGGGAVVFAGG